MDLEDESVDVLTIEPAKSDFEQEAFSMPVILDIIDSESEEEIVAVGPGTMRRKSPGEGREWMNGAESGDSGEDRGPSKHPNTNGTPKGQTKARRR